MAVANRRNTAAPGLELRSAVMTLTALVLSDPDIDALTRELDAQAEAAPGLFDQDPVLIDLSRLHERAVVPDFAALVALLRRHRLLPVAARGGNPTQMAAARDAGLADAPDEAPVRAPRAESVPTEPAVPSTAPDVAQDGQPEAAPVALMGPLPDAPPAATPDAVAQTVADTVPDVLPMPDRRINPAAPTMVIDRPLRSGQQVYARGADLVVLALVSHGAEVIADGSIHVYAPLRGRAIAGARGHTGARIFSTCMEPQLISIAGTYRTFESPLPAEVLGHPAQVRLDGERLVVEPLEDNATPTPDRSVAAPRARRGAGPARA